MQIKKTSSETFFLRGNMASLLRLVGDIGIFTDRSGAVRSQEKQEERE